MGLFENKVLYVPWLKMYGKHCSSLIYLYSLLLLLSLGILIGNFCIIFI